MSPFTFAVLICAVILAAGLTLLIAQAVGLSPLLIAFPALLGAIFLQARRRRS